MDRWPKCWSRYCFIHQEFFLNSRHRTKYKIDMATDHTELSGSWGRETAIKCAVHAVAWYGGQPVVKSICTVLGGQEGLPRKKHSAEQQRPLSGQWRPGYWRVLYYRDGQVWRFSQMMDSVQTTRSRSSAVSVRRSFVWHHTSASVPVDFTLSNQANPTVRSSTRVSSST